MKFVVKNRSGPIRGRSTSACSLLNHAYADDQNRHPSSTWCGFPYFSSRPGGSLIWSKLV
jgi:hypothetical protein